VNSLKIIGEKINGTRRRVAQAIRERDLTFIQDLARKQADAGADWLDVNAGTHPSRETDDLLWMIEGIQTAVQTPLCLDSSNPEALAAVTRAVDRTPMVNSVNGEPSRLEGMLRLVAELGCQVIALAMDDKGVPKTAEERLAVIRRVVAEARRLGMADEKLYIDPLATTISTETTSGLTTLNTIRSVRAEFPDVHLTCGLSNISFGLPARSYANRVFLTLALEAGLDSAIMDPLDKELRAALVTTELVLGRDDHCLNYTRSYRAGTFSKIDFA